MKYSVFDVKSCNYVFENVIQKLMQRLYDSANEIGRTPHDDFFNLLI